MATRSAQTQPTTLVRITRDSPCDVVHVGDHRVERDAPLRLPRDEAISLAAQSDHLTVEDA